MSIIALIPYGSRVYGTYTETSDLDVVVLVDTTQSPTEWKTDDVPPSILDYKIMDTSTFQQMLDEQEISVIEAFFTSPLGDNGEFKHLFKYTVDPCKLRHSVSKKSSNSWVKCKKKLTVEEGQDLIGMKSMFHAFRMVDFAIQLVKTNTIYDFSSANHFWKDIQEIGPDWQKLETIMKPKYNNILSEFRKVAPK